VPHLRDGLLRLEAGQWRRAMDLQTLADPESDPVARLEARLGTDERTHEQQWITALEKPLSGG